MYQMYPSSEVKVENEMTVGQEMVTGGDGDGRQVTRNPVQQFVEVVNKKRQKLTEEFLAKQDTLNASTADMFMSLLKDLGETLGVAPGEKFDELSDSNDIEKTAKLYVSKIKSEVKNVVKRRQELELMGVDLYNKVCSLESKLKQSDAVVREKNEKEKQNATCLQTLQEKLDESEASKRDRQLEVVAMRLDLDLQMQQRAVIRKQVATLQADVLKKQKTIDDMKDMQEKAAKIKRLNEERVQTRKELEDMEDALSREIKTLQMRKIFVQNMQNKLKAPTVEDTEKQKAMEKSYHLTMQSITALRNDLGRLHGSVRQ